MFVSLVRLSYLEANPIDGILHVRARLLAIQFISDMYCNEIYSSEISLIVIMRSIVLLSIKETVAVSIEQKIRFHQHNLLLFGHRF